MMVPETNQPSETKSYPLVGFAAVAPVEEQTAVEAFLSVATPGRTVAKAAVGHSQSACHTVAEAAVEADHQGSRSSAMVTVAVQTATAAHKAVPLAVHIVAVPVERSQCTDFEVAVVAGRSPSAAVAGSERSCQPVAARTAGAQSCLHQGRHWNCCTWRRRCEARPMRRRRPMRR